MNMTKSITIDGVEYVRKDSIKDASPAKSVKGMKYVIARTYSAGVFAGYLKSREGKEATLLNARRLWYWKGAASLSQLAEEGSSCPSECKFPCEVASVTLTEVIELLDVTEKGKAGIDATPVWKQ